MKLSVTLDYDAGGLYQINSVKNLKTGKLISDKVDLGKHFHIEEDKKLGEYLKSVFGPKTTYIVD